MFVLSLSQNDKWNEFEEMYYEEYIYTHTSLHIHE